MVFDALQRMQTYSARPEVDMTKKEKMKMGLCDNEADRGKTSKELTRYEQRGASTFNTRYVTKAARGPEDPRAKLT